MRNRILSVVILSAFVFVLAVMVPSSLVMAMDTGVLEGKMPYIQSSYTQPPHLIQTVTDQDIFEGLLSLGFLESPVLETEDCEKAYENVKDCVVRIQMGNAYGSGVVWEMTPEHIVIVTNKHVLEYWEEPVSYVRFPQEFYVEAKILGISETYDVGFLVIDNLLFDYESLEQLQYVHINMAAYELLQPGDEIFCVGETSDTIEHTAFYPGSIGDMWQYIEEFGEYMIYGYGYARPGMSGGGTFDAKGNFIGMISGGTTQGETASVPLPLIIEAYQEISGIAE